MSFTVFGLDYHIININLYFFMDQIMQQSGGYTLVSSTSIFKAKWHNLVAICPYGVMKEVSSISFRAIFILLYPENPSMNDSKACPVVLSTKISM